MCGIAGIVNVDPDVRADDGSIRRMCETIRHRGPDATGLMCEGSVALGMTRLSIIDVAGGMQPIYNEDRSVAIVYNGEIYNHVELRKKLEARGHRFRSDADTECVVHLYEEYGRDCVQYLRGMFAFAIWDAKARKLFAARDRLGIKPLHYALDGQRLLLASEIKAILSVASRRREVHATALVAYTGFGYVPDPLTMFEGIYKLPPGHWLEFSAGQLETKEYWDVSYVTPTEPREESYYVDRALAIAEEAVRIRLMSEVPLGAFLSGGTDSSVVVALMARHMSAPVKTFSIGFDDDAYNELAYARAVAEFLGTEHHEEIVKPDAQRVVPELVRQFDEPFADSSAIPTYYVARIARKGVTVALSGDGGDELFAGYRRYVEPRHQIIANAVPSVLRDGTVGLLASVLPNGARGIDYLRDMIGNRDDQYIRGMTHGLTNVRKQVFSDTIVQRAETVDPSPIAARFFRRMGEADALSRRQYVDTKTYLPGDILTKVDRTSMLVSLEARVPLLDHELVEFAATIPSHMRIQSAVTKVILKKVGERLLPADLIYRAKKGFSVPVASWIRSEWKEMCHDLVLGDRALQRSNFQASYLRRLVQEHQSARRDNSTAIWSLMMLELWYREMIDS